MPRTYTATISRSDYRPKRITARRTNYSNDATGQLTVAGSTNYGYDANGNPNGPGDVVGTNNQLLSDGKWNYSYDRNGNQIGKVNIATGENWTYGYNNVNQMISAVDKDAVNNVLQSVAYAYDALATASARR